MSSFVITQTTASQSPSVDVAPAVTNGNLETFCYPEDLLADKVTLSDSGASKVTPFIGFFIFVPVTSRAAQTGEGDNTFDVTQTQDFAISNGLDYAAQVNLKLDLSSGDAAVASGKAAVAAATERIRIFRQVQALQTFICLYMPETLNSDLNANYTGRDYGGGKITAAASLLEVIKAMQGKDAVEKSQTAITDAMAAIPVLGSITAAVKDIGTFAQAGRGSAINPLSEVFFENMLMRQFNFDFKFVPKSASEADQLRSIIKKFRMYMVPELNKDAAGGTFFSVPAFFQIKYYIQQGGSMTENLNLPKISACALTGVQTDMAPDGVALHQDGAPVSIRMQLNFKELEIMHRDRIVQGY